MQFYGAISKIDEEQRMVYGYATTDSVDRSGEIVTKDAIAKALDDYLEYANVREMHQLSAVGKTVEATIDDKGLYIGAKIIDDGAWAKVISGVYSGFSIGGKVLARDAKDKKIITKVQLNEISVVDRPQNPDAKFDIWKADAAGDLAKAEGIEMIEEEIPKAHTAADVAKVATEPDADAALVTATEAAEAGAVAEAAPDPVAKAAAAVDALEALAKPTLEKGMFAVSRFADLIQSIAYLASDAEYEAEGEGDGSSIPAALRSWLTAGAQIFKDMATEEVSELIALATTKKAAAGGDLEKTVAIDDLQKAVDDAVAKVSDDLAKKTAEAEDLIKRLAEKDAAFTEFGERVEKSVAAIGERLSKVEEQPAPAKTAGPGAAALVISKGADATGSAGEERPELSDAELKKVLDGMTEEERALALIKAAYRFPAVISR